METPRRTNMAMVTISDNVYTAHFTPREYQVELFDIALKNNVIFSLGNTAAKVFLTIKSIEEAAAALLHNNQKAAILYLENDKSMKNIGISIKNLTNLNVLAISDVAKMDADAITNAHVIITDYKLFSLALSDLSAMQLSEFHLIIFNDCQLACTNKDIQQILRMYEAQPRAPRVLGLSSSLLDVICTLPALEITLNHVQRLLKSRLETASDIASILRYSNKPIELVIEYASHNVQEHLTETITRYVAEVEEFLLDHRFNPFEIYDDVELVDELRQMPEPTVEPRNLIAEFLLVLNHLGVWSANEAAAVLLKRIEKLKIHTRYDRHFLLLCLVSSLFVKIRCFLCDYLETHDPIESIEKFSSSKILRLIEFFRQIKMPDKKNCDENLNKTERTLVSDISDKFGADSTNFNSNNCDMNKVNQSVSTKRISFRNKRATLASSGSHERGNRRVLFNPDDLCGIIFVQSSLIAPVLYALFRQLNTHDPRFEYIYVQFLVDKSMEGLIDPKDVEKEHRDQENALKKFRLHTANLLIATSILEDGIDIPKCNVIVHFDTITSYKSYVYGKGRARIPGAYYVFLVEENKRDSVLTQLAEFHELERLVLKHCSNVEPPTHEEKEADEYFKDKIVYYQPRNSITNPLVTLNTAISLVNRYCSRLPSDTFTRLTALSAINQVDGQNLYQCSLRLPINSRLKNTIIGPPMFNRVLARRMTALKACELLHKIGELDDKLQPISKETFLAMDPSWENFSLNDHDERLSNSESEIRPGTTKRRQYYDKRIARCFENCRPATDLNLYLYIIKMTLTCPLPEEQNTRGRRIYPPEDFPQGFGILTAKPIPKISAFPIFTRSGEINVDLRLINDNLRCEAEQLEKIEIFVHYLFTNVLKLQKYLMAFDPARSPHSYYIVPTYTTSSSNDASENFVNIDWDFVNKIHLYRVVNPAIIPESDRVHYEFDPKKYEDAVIMPWYRSQNRPQHFYVAEICYHLSPKSAFPGENYNTFEEYYFQKYDLKIQKCSQPLLDVDHTSARLNFLTPRYVNRKGVALPTSSEATKRAKRENLEQKQILVPELCTIHPFPSSLWRKAVCLPCVLYRINALLLADEIRLRVFTEIGLGQSELDKNFCWSTLNFGWSLAVVLKRSNELKALKKEAEELGKVSESKSCTVDDEIKPASETKSDTNAQEECDGTDESEKNDDDNQSDENYVEIGVWSNEMAKDCVLKDDLSSDYVTNHAMMRYGSPTAMLDSDDDDCYDDDSLYNTYSNDTDSDEPSGIRIEFKGDTAEAIEDETKEAIKIALEEIPGMNPTLDSQWQLIEQIEVEDEQKIRENIATSMKLYRESIAISGRFFDKNTPILIGGLRQSNNAAELDLDSKKEMISIESLDYNDAVVDFSCHSKMYDTHCGYVIKENLELNFSFDFQPDLSTHPGPSPSILLQALTMSNANDGINLERLETIGDSFLKHAITCYLYCVHENVHEGKLSNLRSKLVSNLNLYRVGRKHGLSELMVGSKFEPHDNWLPPCFYICPEDELCSSCDEDDECESIDCPICDENRAGLCCQMTYITHYYTTSEMNDIGMRMLLEAGQNGGPGNFIDSCIPYNLLTQQSIPDKSIADSVEALIGAYLIDCGPRGALLFMSWVGIRVLPLVNRCWLESDEPPQPLRPVGSTNPLLKNNTWHQTVYGEIEQPKSPLLNNVLQPQRELENFLRGYELFEQTINYKFGDRAYLLQAFTHASYYPNQLTDCYQRLEFLGDAVLDYLITRHLYEDVRQHSPGALTDLRSALVNNTIFATLAVKFDFHKYFRHLSPGLQTVIDRFVRFQEANNYQVTEDYYLIEDPENEEVEDIEVPKVLGDIFESIAGAIYLDSNMSLDTVWKVYYQMMQPEIELFSVQVPKSPVRELLELEPETAKFSKPEKLADGRRVRVTVEIFGKGTYKGIGRNYRIAKCTAAKCALRQLKKQGLISRQK